MSNAATMPATASRAGALHWAEYGIEGALLGVFMVSACSFAVLLEHPATSAHAALPDPLVRRALMGMAMGLTAAALVYSPWGQRSGAHMNPALTLTFWRLGKVATADALAYAAAQFAGGIAGVLLVRALLGALAGHPAVHYAATVPGPSGVAAAFVAEVGISFLLMTTVLFASNTPRLMRVTGLLSGALVAIYIAVEAPLSGMSMNPARSFASALVAGEWSGLWVYFTAPPLGMWLAAGLYRRLRGSRRVFCAKLQHSPTARCIFRCHYHDLEEAA